MDGTYVQYTLDRPGLGGLGTKAPLKLPCLKVMRRMNSPLTPSRTHPGRGRRVNETRRWTDERSWSPHRPSNQRADGRFRASIGQATARAGKLNSRTRSFRSGQGIVLGKRPGGSRKTTKAKGTRQGPLGRDGARSGCAPCSECSLEQGEAQWLCSYARWWEQQVPCEEPRDLMRIE